MDNVPKLDAATITVPKNNIFATPIAAWIVADCADVTSAARVVAVVMVVVPAPFADTVSDPADVLAIITMLYVAAPNPAAAMVTAPFDS